MAALFLLSIITIYFWEFFFFAKNTVISSPSGDIFYQNDLAESVNVDIAFGTEIYDQNGDFASSVFTAPVTGTYFFNVFASLKGVPLDARYINLFITV